MLRAIVVANGELPHPDTLRHAVQPGDLLIAADGGAGHCHAAGLTPAVVVGDLDSLAPETRTALTRAGARFEQHPAGKDETDLELALLHAAGQGADPILVLGALGGRLDMTLANILLLTHPRLLGRRVVLQHGAQAAWLIRPPGDFAIRGRPGDTLSLVPLGGDATGITTQGLAYPLRGEALVTGPARGVSNVLTGTEAQVALGTGLLLATHTPGRA